MLVREIWQVPTVQSAILDYLESSQLLASFTTMGSAALREGAQWYCSMPERVGSDVLLLCQFDFSAAWQ
ncbi:MAG: hypothetical protein ACYCY0_03150 [Acidithiobacillus ferrivorans]